MRCRDDAGFRGAGRFLGVKLAAFVLSFQIVTGIASATPVYTLSSGNSSVGIDLGSQAGMYNWTVDGQNQLNQQWFWYRVGSSGPEASIDTIGTPTVNLISPSILDTTYFASLFSVDVLYSLVGVALGSGASDLSETIKIQNLTSGSLSFHFFQYADFNLGGTPNNDSGQLDKTSKGYNEVDQTDGSCHLGESVDTVVSHAATHAEVASDNSILTMLNNGTASAFNGNMYTAGNVKWGLEWDVNIAAGGTYLISKDLNVSGVVPVTVPEPSAWSFVLLGLFAGGMWKVRSVRRVGWKRFSVCRSAGVV
ncbi:MAG: PEP-CTERM sorting domain-containing protein [Verrucomicrobiota bacterium]|jgi:hypothetical protein